jgi:transposase
VFIELFSKKKAKRSVLEAFNGKESETISYLIDCLSLFYKLFDSLDVNLLDQFIATYSQSPYENVKTFVSGLQKDIEAVKNTILYPNISNGPIEGLNNKIKMLRRRSFGRAGVLLMNLLIHLTFFPKDDSSQAINVASAVVT